MEIAKTMIGSILICLSAISRLFLAWQKGVKSKAGDKIWIITESDY